MDTLSTQFHAGRRMPEPPMTLPDEPDEPALSEWEEGLTSDGVLTDRTARRATVHTHLSHDSVEMLIHAPGLPLAHLGISMSRASAAELADWIREALDATS